MGGAPCPADRWPIRSSATRACTRWIRPVDLATAISAYTAGGAYANFCEHDRGRLSPGQAADLIALSDDLFQMPAGRIKDCRVDLTMVAGQIHHQLW